MFHASATKSRWVGEACSMFNLAIVRVGLYCFRVRSRITQMGMKQRQFFWGRFFFLTDKTAGT